MDVVYHTLGVGIAWKFSQEVYKKDISRLLLSSVPVLARICPLPRKSSTKLLGAVDTRRYPRSENRAWSDQEDHKEREDRRIVRQALVDPTVTHSTIRADVGVAIVPQIISRHLAEANPKSKRPFRALPLTPKHRQLRLQWCQARSMWNVTDWQNVVFSDESRFVLRTDDNRARVWRRPGSFLNGLSGEIFEQDNARPHAARVVQDFLRHFQTLPWSARSPDLFPLDHV
ncbi:transposable element Tc1 transposase [Trichonephila clavipes]|nr:transposable element Tc1 transposase [Trichonephila clavipes]